MPEAEDAGVGGVIGQVRTLVTGAAGAGGFKGRAGRHARNGLLRYGDATVDRLRLRRLDTGETVSIKLDASPVPVDPTQRQLLGLVLQGSADAAPLRELGRLGQERVRRLLLSTEDGGVGEKWVVSCRYRGWP